MEDYILMHQNLVTDVLHTRVILAANCNTDFLAKCQDDYHTNIKEENQDSLPTGFDRNYKEIQQFIC